MDKNLLQKSAIELRKLITNKDISPVELTKLSLERIDEIDQKTNCFITVTPENAIKAAKKIEDKILKGEKLGRMVGIPTSIKDLEPVKGVRMTKGSLSFEKVIANQDQICVERIKNEDGIILGKTNCSEFGHSGTNENKLGEDTRNPWNLDCTSGASSGGAGVSVLTSVNTVAQASDGGGSTRIPASFCGLYGMIGTTGRIPRRRAGLLSWLPVNYSRIGPISWYVEDTALLFQVMSGPHKEAESLTIESSPPDFLAKINNFSFKGKKIGWSHDLGSRYVDPEIKEITESKVRIFEELGANLEELKFEKNLNELEKPLHEHVMFTLSYCTNNQFLQDNPSKLMPHVENTILRGKKVTGEEYLKGLCKLFEFKNYVDSLFKRYDFIITPTMAIPPHKIDEKPIIENNQIKMIKLNYEEIFEKNNFDYSSWNFVLLQMTAPFNWSGNPAATLPCGFTKKNLPVGLQIIAPKMKEDELFRASKAFENIFPWHKKRPNI